MSKIKVVLLAILVSISSSLVGGLSAASASTAVPVIDWDIYHSFRSAIGYTCNGVSKTSVPLRYGDFNFGLTHIGDRHGDFNDFDLSATGWALFAGTIDFSQVNQGKHIYRVRYQNRNVVVVVSFLCQSPQDNDVNGVITSFYE